VTVSSIDLVDAGSPDKRLHTNQRTIASNAREDQYFLRGQPAYPSYTVVVNAVSTATTNDHLLQIMADGTNYTRLVRYSVSNANNKPASLSALQIAVYRLTTAGTGGTAKAEAAYDDADNYTGDIRYLPSSKGTEGQLIHRFWTNWPSTASTSAPLYSYTWEMAPYMKPLIFGNSSSDGIAFKVLTAVASMDVSVQVEMLTTSYL